MKWKCQNEIQLEHVSKKFLIQKIPDEVSFKNELKDPGKNTNGSQWPKAVDNLAYHIVEWIRVL